MSTTLILLRGALALELAPALGDTRDALTQADAGALAAKIARDLARFSNEAASLELSVVGAHYDPVELLRPGWPVHDELHQLAARAPGDRSAGGGRIVAFGTHDGRLPGALSPSTDHAGGPLRLVPWQLSGDADALARVSDTFERDLMERGMAGADTALQAQEAFGLRVEHARHLTLHDLCAMIALQYEHAGIAPLWPVLEAALLSPDREVWIDAPPEPPLHYAAREARIALLSPDAWRAWHVGDAADSEAVDDGSAASAASGIDDAALRRAFAHFEARQRQFAAVLMAHGVPVTFVGCTDDGDLLQQLR